MERTWDIGGVYGNWRMMVTVEPPDEPSEVELPERTLNYFSALARHFAEVVNLCENLTAARTL